MKAYTVYEPMTGRILRSGMADRPEWHLQPGEALIVGEAASPHRYHVEDGVIVAGGLD